MQSFILFKEDWNRFDRAIVDTETKNRSFLELSYKLKTMGIKNHQFPLQLHDPVLQGVDPFDYDNLTLDLMTRIGIECRLNPFYILREITRAPPDTGLISNPIDANRANISTIWCFFNYVIYSLIQPRQTGKTLTVLFLLEAIMNFMANNTSINYMTLSEKNRKDIILKLKKIYDELPIYLRYRNNKDDNNQESFSVNAWTNKLSVHIAQASEKAAYALGRGLTTPM